MDRGRPAGGEGLMIRNKYVLFLFRFVIGGLFIYAGVLKIADPLGFAQDIRNYRLFSQEICFLTALVLPWFEVLAGAFLILGIFKRTSALLISGLLAFFIVLVAITMIRGIDVDCGCFGTLSRKADWKLLVEDLLMLAMSLSVALAPSRAAEK
jgi:putative oxidoreductase